MTKGMSVKPRTDTSEHKQRVSASVTPQYQHHFINYERRAYTYRRRTQGINKYKVVEEPTQGSSGAGGSGSGYG